MRDRDASRLSRSNLLLMFASILIALLAAEAVFRRLDLRGYHRPRTREWQDALVPPEERLPGVSVQFKPHSQFTFGYDSNPRGYFDSTGGLTYRTNNQGFRGPDFEVEKPPGSKRVLVLGDSFTFGEGVRDDDTFCAQLQQHLRRDSGRTVEVLNLGTSAWTTLDEIAYLEQRGVQFHPDLVIVVYVLNDAEIAGGLNVWETFRNKYEPAALRHSYVASYAFAAVARRSIGRRYIQSLVQEAITEDEKWQRSFAALSRGRRAAAAAGARFMVAIFPFMYDLSATSPMLPIHRRIGAHCAEDSIECLDLFDAFAGRKDTDLWVHASDQHPNEIGHRIAAEAMFAHIVHHALLAEHPAAPPPAQHSGRASR